MKVKLTRVLVLSCAMPVAAQDMITEQSGPDQVTARENPVSTVPYESGNDNINDQRSTINDQRSTIDAETTVVSSRIGKNVLNVEIDQATAEPWNYLIGGQWDINRSFAILAEFGFGERKSQMLNLTYRF